MKSDCFTIDSDPAALKDVRDRMERYARKSGFDEDAVGMLVMATDETLTNIIRHAYDGAPDGRIDIELCVKDGSLCIILRDYGSEVEAEKIQGRDLDNIRPGGLGVHIINTCVDVVEYFSAEGGGTRTVLKKTLPGSHTEEEET